MRTVKIREFSDYCTYDLYYKGELFDRFVIYGRPGYRDERSEISKFLSGEYKISTIKEGIEITKLYEEDYV